MTETKQTKACSFGRLPTVLIVGLAADTEGWFAKQLRDFGCDVLCADTVSRFLDNLDRKHRELIVVKIFEPDSRAISEVVSLRTYFGAGPSTYILAVTTETSGDLEKRLQNAGCDRIIKEQGNSAEMLEIAESVIRSYV